MNRTLSGRDVLLWLVGFFGIIIAVNVWFIIASVATFSGEDEQKPYLQGVEYNQTLARRAEQRRLGWRATIASIRTGNIVKVSLSLRQPDGLPVRGLSLEGELRHPADEERDRPALFKEISPGVYGATVAGITPGAWDLVAETGAKQPPFETVKRLWLP